MIAFWTVAALLALLIALGGLESWNHRKNLKSIPIRIHVNGTRGKSSVTRLIAAALREAGIRTVAKTTGTLPRLILPDGTERAVQRVSRANVIEQVGIVNAAGKYRAEALVIECMALQPHLQWLCEAKFVQATHGVITNARADHLDVMGPTETDVARALCNMTPQRGRLFTAERDHLAVLDEAARDRGTELIPTSLEDVQAVTDEELAGFRYAEHKENVALVLTICRELGIDRETALRGMWKAERDPGAMTLHEIEFCGRRIVFANAFAANDPESTGQAWNRAIEAAGDVRTRIALVNCRADRPDRSWQLGEACPDWQPADYYLLAGTGTSAFARAAEANGVDPGRIALVDASQVSHVFEQVVELAGESAVVVGMGNIGTHGLAIAQYFQNRTMPRPRVPAVATAGPTKFFRRHGRRRLHRPVYSHRSGAGAGQGSDMAASEMAALAR